MTYLKCDNCDNNVWKCVRCKQEFEEGEEINCLEGKLRPYHLCESCVTIATAINRFD